MMSDCISSEMESDNSQEEFLNLVEIREESYQADVVLLDRYQAYSSELLRLSLAGLGAVGFFLANKLAAGIVVKVCLAVGVLLFGLAAGCALAHRYHSSDGIFYHLRSIRLSHLNLDKSRIKCDVKKMTSIYNRSERYLRLACIFLGSGALVIALGVIATFLY